jgi:hypothetical protein
LFSTLLIYLNFIPTINPLSTAPRAMDWKAAGLPLDQPRSPPSPHRVCGGTAKPFLYLQNVFAHVQNVLGDVINVLLDVQKVC